MQITLSYGLFRLDLTTAENDRDSVQKVEMSGDAPAIAAFRDLVRRGRLGGVHGHMIDLDSVTNTDLLAACKLLPKSVSAWTFIRSSVPSFDPIKIPEGTQT